MCIRDSLYSLALVPQVLIHYDLTMILVQIHLFMVGLSIASKLERECLGGCGVVVAQWSEHWRLKPEALGSILSGCPDVFSSSKLSDVDSVMSSVVL